MMRLATLTFCILFAATVVASSRVETSNADPSADRPVMMNFVKDITGLGFNTSSPVCQWPNITCDDAHNVVGIQWTPGWNATDAWRKPRGPLGGSFDFTKLPPKLKVFDISSNNFTIMGPDFTNLPSTLRVFRVYNSYLCNFVGWVCNGNVSFSFLPPALEEFMIGSNPLACKVPAMDKLPATLRIFDASTTYFNGSVNLSAAVLPSTLEVVNFADCDKLGPYDLTNLPNLRELRLDSGGFRQDYTMDINNLPASLEVFTASGQTFNMQLNASALPRGLKVFNVMQAWITGTLNLEDLPRSLEWVNLEMNDFVERRDVFDLSFVAPHTSIGGNLLYGQANFSTVPAGTEFLYVGDTLLTGPMDLSNLPSSMKLFDVSYSNFTGPVTFPPNHVKLLPELKLSLEGNRHMCFAEPHVMVFTSCDRIQMPDHCSKSVALDGTACKLQCPVC